MLLKKVHSEKRLAKLNKMRNTTLKKRLKLSKLLFDCSNKYKTFSKIKDLIRLKRYFLDISYIEKFLNKFERLYKIRKISKHEKSVVLKNITENNVKNRYHVNDIILFVQ